MKNTLLILMSLLLCGCTDHLDASDASISLAADYSDRPYTPEEPVGVDLVITAHRADGDYCYFTARCDGGAATLSVDGEAVAWGEKQTAYYDLLNENSASRTMHCVITPSPSEFVSQTLVVEFTVSTAALEQQAVQRIEIQVVNSHPIFATVNYDTKPFEVDMLLNIELTTEKQGFCGVLEAVATLKSGAGYFVYSGKRIDVGASFELPCPGVSTLQYQPTTKGVHEIVLTLTDGMQSTTVEIRTEVYNNGGLESPPNGIYIYAGGVYYSRTRWQDSKPTVKAEGVAVVADPCRFLIALKDVRGTWCGYEDIRKIEGLPTYTDEALARTDYDGLQNTRKILAALDAGILSSANLARACYNYDKSTPGLWYMPASGQIALIVDNFVEIRLCLWAIPLADSFESDNTFYVTSTGHNMDVWAMIINPYFGPKLGYRDTNYGSYCRPVRTLK